MSLSENSSFDDFAQWMRDNDACAEAQEYAARYEGSGKTIGEVFDDLGDTASHPDFESGWSVWLLKRLADKVSRRVRVPLWRFMRRDGRRADMLRAMRRTKEHLSQQERDYLRGEVKGRMPNMEVPDDFAGAFGRGKRRWM